MKNNLKFLAIAVIMCGLAIPTIAQVTQTSSATAVIIQTITLAENQNLNFGYLAVTTIPGSCILDPMTGIPHRTATGGVTLPATIGAPLAAEFLVTGVANQFYTISIPQTDLTITDITVPNVGQTMTVNTYTCDQPTYPTVPGEWHGQLDSPTGAGTFYVGATVIVSANQAPGVYQNLTGFPVTVNYQ